MIDKRASEGKPDRRQGGYPQIFQWIEPSAQATAYALVFRVIRVLPATTATLNAAE